MQPPSMLEFSSNVTRKMTIIAHMSASVGESVTRGLLNGLIDSAVDQRLARERFGGSKPYAAAHSANGGGADYGKRAAQEDSRENKHARHEDERHQAQAKTHDAQPAEQSSGSHRRSSCFFYMRGDCRRGEHCDRPHIAAKEGDICPFRENSSFGEKCALAATHEERRRSAQESGERSFPRI